MAKTVKFLVGVFFLISLTHTTFAQIISPPQWTIQLSDREPAVGDEVELIFNAKIPETWYIYSNDFDPDLGPLLTELILEDSIGVEKKGTLRAIAPKKKYEEIWEGDVTYFDKEGEFRQTFSVTAEAINIKGVLFYQMCSDISGQCVNYEEDFSVQVKANSPVKVIE